MHQIPWNLLFALLVGALMLPPAPATARGDSPKSIEEEMPEDPFGPPPEGAVLGVEIGIDDPSGSSLLSFHHALRRAGDGKGKARILFFGASHVASDLFTGHIRRELQARFGDAGHGFILPAKPWKHYRHRNILLESNKRWDTHKIKVHHTEPQVLGLAGVSVSSSSRRAYGAIETARSGPVGRTASEFEVYYQTTPGGGDVRVFIDGQRMKGFKTRGRKTGAGYKVYKVIDAPHRFEVRPAGKKPVRLFGVSVERDEPGVVVDTLGINGARARYQLLWNDAVFREHLIKRNPDMVVLAYGTNESGDNEVPISRYEENLTTVVSRIREVVGSASCLLIGPSDRPTRLEDGTLAPRPRTAAVIDTQRRVAHAHGCGFFDLVAFGGGPMSMVLWTSVEPPMGAPDYIHYTRLGYQRLGEVLLKALMKDFEDEPPELSAPR